MRLATVDVNVLAHGRRAYLLKVAAVQHEVTTAQLELGPANRLGPGCGGRTR